MVNTPIPSSLKSEAKKAAKILREFTMPSAKSGPDKLIPAGILAKARGLAMITVFKAGFLVTARGGSGIVIAKVDDSLDFAQGWSAPSAIGLAGLGGGFEIGAEVTDFVIILNTKTAVDAFSKGGNLTLGGNFTIAAGPLGRNLEGDIAVRSAAAIYTYSKTKGIFAGISVEGSALIERKDANKKFYGKEIRAHQILNGEVDPPEECQALYDVMREQQEFAIRAATDMAKHKAIKQKEKMEEKAVAESYTRYQFSKDRWRSKSTKSKNSSSSLSENPSRSSSEWALSGESPSTSVRRKDSWSGPSSSPQSTSSLNKETSHDPWNTYEKHRGASARPQQHHNDDDDDDAIWAVADFTFHGQLSCDLPFRAGDRIKVTTHTKKQDDWWEGINSAGRQGIFPANYVHVAS